MKRVILSALAVLATLAASAQEPPAKPAKPPTAPTKPVVPGVEAKPSTTLTPAQSLPADLEVALAPKAQKLAAVAQVKASTPTTRSRIATKLVKESVTISNTTPTMAVGPSAPIASSAWLSMQGGLWRTGPSVPAMIFLPNVTVNPQANVTLKFSAAASARYLLVCDLSSPEVWDVIVDGRAAALTPDGDAQGAALIPAVNRAATRTLKLVVQRISTPAAPLQHETFRRCEITAIPG